MALSFAQVQTSGTAKGLSEYGITHWGLCSMISGSALLIILIGGVLFDLDAWGIALAIFFCLLFAGYREECEHNGTDIREDARRKRV